jgi:hypothetical protein
MRFVCLSRTKEVLARYQLKVFTVSLVVGFVTITKELVK